MESTDDETIPILHNSGIGIGLLFSQRTGLALQCSECTSPSRPLFNDQGREGISRIAPLKKELDDKLLTWVEVDVGGGTRCDEGDAHRPSHRFFIIEHLELIHMGMPEKLSRDGAFISEDGSRRKKKEKRKKVLQIIYSFYKTLRESEMKVLEYISARESRSLNSVARFFSLSRTEQTVDGHQRTYDYVLMLAIPFMTAVTPTRSSF